MPSVLWLTDRTRYQTGLSSCPRERYLENHSGPTGYGMRLKAVSMPQVRGIYSHVGLAYLLATVTEQDALPTIDQTREAVRLSVGAYTRVVEARGLRLLGDEDRVETIIKEQCALLTGLTWVFALEVLPWWHAEYRAISIEQEEVAVLGCTCGLGDLIGTQEEHEARDCAGIGWQSRADIVAEHRLRGSLEYHEFKTSGYPKRAEDYETTIQFAAGVLGVEQRLERPIDAAMVINLITGKREASYNYLTKKKDGEVRQQSILCYGYKKPAPAPGMIEEWAAEYDYVDDQNRNRRLGKEYQKAGIWTMDPTLTGGLDPAEWWVRALSSQQRGQQVALIGPLQRQTAVLEGFKQEMVHEERRWQERTWELYEIQDALAKAGVENPWAHPEFQAALNRIVPRSWACRRFGQRYECQFKKSCFGETGWETPFDNGYMLRRPHHTPEVLQAEARGIPLPDDEGETQED